MNKTMSQIAFLGIWVCEPARSLAITTNSFLRLFFWLELNDFRLYISQPRRARTNAKPRFFGGDFLPKANKYPT